MDSYENNALPELGLDPEGASLRTTSDDAHTHACGIPA
jgi:hypothetical protein